MLATPTVNAEQPLFCCSWFGSGQFRPIRPPI